MKVPEIKKEFIKFKPKPNFFFPKFNIIFFRPFTIYPSETQQQQEDATVINMEQNNQLTTNTRDAQDENSGGWGANCRDSLNYCLAGCLNALCCFSFNSAASN
ncbi:9677_t:CDS:2 [Rhizophagus irregularis]|nr:9677_t:CDS:2 [Rhizophagus irregularis]